MTTISPKESLSSPDAKEVRDLFSSISKTYDRANDVMTLGMAHAWRKKLVEWSDAKPGDAVLDCATGTGDLALEFKRVVKENGRVCGSDFCKEMLEIAPHKAMKADLDVEFEIADVTQLPYKDCEFNICSIAYGIRNVNNPHKALSEMARVTKSEGVVMILETGEAKTPVLKSAIQWYFKNIVPRVGAWISGNKAAYEYLNQSSSQFPCKEDFLKIMEKTQRFKKLEYKSLMGGASFIYKGTVK